MLEVENLTKIYQLGGSEVRALAGVNLQIERGELVSIMGPSGSGKSTLLAILGCLDAPTSGVYRLNGVNVESLNEVQLAQLRNRRIGFVFQQFNLLPRTTALENVMLPLTYGGVSGQERRQRAVEALRLVGLGERLSHRSNELSGGEQQRVAIARASVNAPDILLADEPTGALDSKTGAEIIALLQRLHQELKQTIVYVTHDESIARHTHRLVRLADGQIVSDLANPHPLEAGQVGEEERPR